MAGLLRDEDRDVRAAAVEFFKGREGTSEEIQRSIAKLLKDSEKDVRAAAVRFFVSRKEVSEEIQRVVADLGLLNDSEWNVRAAAVSFLKSRESASEEIQRSIAKLLKDSEKDVRAAAVRFFVSQKEVSEEIQRVVVGLLSDSEWNVRGAAVSFFKGRKEISPSVFEIVGIFFRNKEINIDIIMPFLKEKSISQMMQSSERNVSDGFLIVLVIKSLMSNLPIYQLNKTCIRIESDGVINFESEKELARFVKNFQQVFRELTGLNLDEKFEGFSQANAMSRHGQFPAAQVVSDEEAEELSDEEENRWCVIL